MTRPRELVLELDAESAGVLGGTLLSGESCAVPVEHDEAGRLLLCVESNGSGMRLYLRLHTGS